MSGDFSSANNLLKGYKDTVMKDSWLDGVAGKQMADQKSELKKIFAVVDDNNVNAAQKKSLESRAEILKDKLDRLEAEMAVLSEQIKDNQDKIADQADKIADLVSAAESKSAVLEKQQKANVKNCIEDVFYEYKKGHIGKDAISGEIKKRIRSGSYKITAQGQIERILAQLDAKQAEVQPLVDMAAKWADQLNLFEGKYGAIKSSYDVINVNLAQIGNTDTNYTNSDYDAKVPVYSLEKTDIVSDFFENANMNVAPGENPNYKADAKAPNFDNINAKYGKYFGAGATGGVDANSSANAAVRTLAAAVNAGMLNDLAQSGMNGQQISAFLAKNFGGANIRLSDQGSLSIPYGHDEASRNTFAAVTNFLQEYSSGFLGAPNTWDKEGGNQISTNKQIESLSKNYPEILNKMASDPKFTFKEAMYALFNQETGLFKDSGVIYDPSKHDKNGEPTYFIELAGDLETSKMYKGLAAKIKEIWGVGPSLTVDYDNFDENAPEVKPSAPSVKRTDPISFKQGNTEYAFIVDRDGDGAFSGKEEFVGAQEGSSWLDDLKALDTDGDGKLTGDELKNLKLLGSDYTDNAKTKGNKAGFLREETTNIDYSMTDAAALGITEIDLNGLEDKVNQSKGKNDINGSELFEDGFSFKLNGQDVNATRKDDTNAFMDAVYSDAYGKSFKVGLSEENAQSIIDNAYDEFAQYKGQFDDVFKDVNILKNAGQIAEDARNTYNEAMSRIQADENTQLLRASNKAAAMNNARDWNIVSKEVQEVARKKGIGIDMEQAKGFYVVDGSLSAEQIVNKYQDMVATEKKVASESAVSSEAWNAITLCARNNVHASTEEIMELLTSGQAKTAQDVVDILKQKQG